MRQLVAVFSMLLMFQPVAADARNILITNDDGLTSNVLALYKTLKAAGHDVIVSVPCTNQSGKGAALIINPPLGPLEAPCLNNAAQAGEPGAGPMTRSDLGDDARGDLYYVNGTPVMAALYGLDVLSTKRWNAAPDLVLSGPNEGQNLGAIVLSSGTVSAAQYAAMRHIPAIALSAGSDTKDPELANPASQEVAQLANDLVALLDKHSNGGAMLPTGLALNVNFPDKLDGAVWKISQIGSYNAYELRMVESVAKEATPETVAAAKKYGMTLPDLPGLSFGANTAEPTKNQMNDESVVYRSAIAVSPMQAGYAMAPASADWLTWALEGFVSGD
ncbi:MAG: 5'/3'-nucleotidase SurE [Pontixanthobacter sp.]